MGGLSVGHWVIVLLVVVLLFGRGRISETMEDFGKGIRSFKRGIKDEEAQPVKAIAADTAQAPDAQREAVNAQADNG